MCPSILGRACIPLSQLGGARGGLEPAIDGVGGLKLPCAHVWGAAGVEVAEIAADSKCVDCGGALSPLSVVKNHSHPDVATSGWPTVTQSYPVSFGAFNNDTNITINNIYTFLYFALSLNVFATLILSWCVSLV